MKQATTLSVAQPASAPASTTRGLTDLVALCKAHSVGSRQDPQSTIKLSGQYCTQLQLLCCQKLKQRKVCSSSTTPVSRRAVHGATSTDCNAVGGRHLCRTMVVLPFQAALGLYSNFGRKPQVPDSGQGRSSRVYCSFIMQHQYLSAVQRRVPKWCLRLVCLAPCSVSTVPYHVLRSTYHKASKLDFLSRQHSYIRGADHTNEPDSRLTLRVMQQPPGRTPSTTYCTVVP